MQKWKKWRCNTISEINRTINGYHIYIGGTWCEVTKNGDHIYDGSVEEGMTAEDVYRQKKSFFLMLEKKYGLMTGYMNFQEKDKPHGKILQRKIIVM